VNTQRPIMSEEEHRVLQFRPRISAHPPGQRRFGEPALGGQAQPQVQPQAQPQVQPRDRWPAANDLSRYERSRDEPDDFRHRMLANVAAFAFTVALTAIGIWLAMSIADMRKTQDCVLMGRRDCARISSPHI
jgi:hypothetical protein